MVSRSAEQRPAAAARKPSRKRPPPESEAPNGGAVPAAPRAPLSAAALLAHRQALPIWSARQRLLDEVAAAPTLILTGETGSGKSTQVPQFLRAAGYAETGAIGVTQPRRVAATSLARRVAAEAGVELGAGVGYSVRFDERFDRRPPGRGGTQIKYLTDGMLLREVSGIAHSLPLIFGSCGEGH
jgi:HrpA-like RNA helicase